MLSSSDIPQENEFVEFYQKLGPKPSTTIRLFDRKDFFTFHGVDAVFIAKEIIRTQTIIKYISPLHIPSIALNINKLEMILKELLLIRHYRVEIYKNFKTSRTTDCWKIDVTASPGNLGPLEEILYSPNDNSSGLASIKLTSTDLPLIGFSFVNSTDQVMQVVQFEDNAYLTTFEAVLLQCAPKEILIQKSFRSSTFFKRFQEIIELNNILITEVKNVSFSEDSFHCKAILKHLLRDNSCLGIKVNCQNNYLILFINYTNIFILLDYIEDNKHAFSSLMSAIEYLQLTDLSGINDDDLSEEERKEKKCFTLKMFDYSSFVRLDSTAIKSLDLFPAHGLSSKMTSSIFQLLNHCRTFAGQRLLTQWIRQPLMDINHINERLDLVEFFVENNEIRESLNSIHLKKVPDLIRLSKKFEQKKASLVDCVRVYQLIKSLPAIKKCLISKDSSILKQVFVNVLDEQEENFEKYTQMVDETIKFDSREEPIINPHFDEHLGQLYDNLNKIEKKVNEVLKTVANKLDLEANKTIKLESNNQVGFNFRVTKKEEKYLRDRNDLIFIDKAKKDAIRFFTKSLKSLNSDYVELKANFDKQQKEIIAEVIKIASQYSEVMRELGDVLAKLDVIVSLATSAKSCCKEYVRPTILEKGDLPEFIWIFFVDLFFVFYT